jgi:hypothetical protein
MKKVMTIPVVLLAFTPFIVSCTQDPVSAPAVESYIGNPIVGRKYEILEVVDVSSDDNYDMPSKYKNQEGTSSFTSLDSKYLLRLNPYAKSYCDQAALYSDETVTLGSQKIEIGTVKNFIIKEYSNTESLFANTEDGVYESQDYGDTWSYISDFAERTPVYQFLSHNANVFCISKGSIWRKSPSNLYYTNIGNFDTNDSIKFLIFSMVIILK